MANASDPGLLSPAECALLTDRYELAMAASYLRRGMNERAVFELFCRHLPPRRDWLLVAGLGPALSLVQALRFGPRELEFLRSLGFEEPFLEYLETFRFTGDVDAMPEGTLVFANEPLLRVSAPRVEAQLLETLLLNQLNFQTAIATKAARIVLAAGQGQPGAGGAVIDFSPRRDHGVDAAMKAARSAAIAGAGGTSNVAAAMRYGLEAVGTMAHSYVLSFEQEEEAFRAFMEDFPGNAVMLVDTYDTVAGVRHAITAAAAVGVRLRAVRLDSGDLLELSRQARALLDHAGLTETRILASGDLEEGAIADLVAAGAPIDLWGVGTDLGTSRDSPAVSGVYKLVADWQQGAWRPVAKRSPRKATVPLPKQVFRLVEHGTMRADVIAASDEEHPGEPLLVPAIRGGERVLDEELDVIRARARHALGELPEVMRRSWSHAWTQSYPVRWSPRLRAAAGRGEPGRDASR